MLMQKISGDVNTALKAQDKNKVSALRFLLADIKKYEIDQYPPGSKSGLTDEDVIKILRKHVKMHRESILAFTKGNRSDLADKETQELEVLKTYLPQEIDNEKLQAVIRQVIAAQSSDNLTANFGTVMGQVMKKVQGQASGDRVKKLVQTEMGIE